MKRMMGIAVGLLLAGFATSAAAADSQSWFYCWARKPALEGVYSSKVFAGGPASARAIHEAAFLKFLQAQKLTGPGGALVQCPAAADQKAAQAAQATFAGDILRAGMPFVSLDWKGTPPPPPPPPPPVTTPAAPAPLPYDPQEKVTAALNQAVEQHDADIRARNAQAKADFEAEQAKFRAAQAEYQRQVAATKAAAAAAERKHAQDMAEWQARVAACKAGDYSQCGPAN